MTTNVINLDFAGESEHLEIIRQLGDRIATLRENIVAVEAELQIKEDESIELEILEASATTPAQRRTHRNDRKIIDAHIKLLRDSIKTEGSRLKAAEIELGKIEVGVRGRARQERARTNAESIFEEHNIHYVIFDQQWWSVDATGGRMDLKINNSESGVIRDLIFHSCDMEINSEQELKRLAKEQGRMYKHIVRDFVVGDRPGVYNQMNTIRSVWLEPRTDRPPHPAFRLLLLSIAGGNEDYADQLERWTAYRYCHPGDVTVPNIDSCATGGTGRDTYYNILRTIFTDECCGSVSTETFRGTHNGDLFGKMIVKVDEKDSNSIPIDKIKEYTGGPTYRHRAMNRDAREVARLFTFIFFRNGYTSTARLAGTGTTGEDRRFEPIIARVNLARHFAHYHGLIPDINTVPPVEVEKAMATIIKEWQALYYKNQEEIALWLGDIINRWNAREMTELLPLHGVYYDEMLQRQKRGIDGFMPKFMTIWSNTNNTVISIGNLLKIYCAAENARVTKDWFKNQVMYWLNTHCGWDCEEVVDNVYTSDSCPHSLRKKIAMIQNRLDIPERKQWDLDDFIDRDAIDDKGSTVGDTINVFSIVDELK